MAGLVEGKAGLVTGAAGGLGRATAVILAREGASVLVTDLPARTADAEETVRLITQVGGRATFLAGDVTVDADAKAAVDATVEAFGRLDFAHNNAGIELQATVTGTTQSEWDAVMNVNVKGVWLGLKHQIERMIAQGGGGSIVNTASLAGLMAVPSLAAYIASKHAVVGLTKAAAVECAPHEIRVNAVCPAWVRTPMADVSMDDLGEERGISREDAYALVSAHYPLRRVGEPDEIAAACVFLASPAASFITGAVLVADGGATVVDVGVLPWEPT